jgi:hypothetical protein
VDRLLGALMRFFEVSETAAIMIAALCCIFFALLTAGLLVIGFAYPFEQPLPFGVGLLTGSILSVYKVILLERSLERSVDMEQGIVRNYSTLQAILRYTLTIAVFLCAVFFPRVIGVFGVVLGALSLQFSAYIANALIKT